MEDVSQGTPHSVPIRLLPIDEPLRAEIRVPGDKSISHRALFLAGVNRGSTMLHGLAPGADVRSTIDVLTRLGVAIEVDGDEARIQAANPRELSADIRKDVTDLYCGNSGTTARLLCGYLAGERGLYRITGDESLSSRPMDRVVDPLASMGMEISATAGHLPIHANVSRAASMHADRPFECDASSAQVHAAVLLAALRSGVPASVRRTAPMRDHTLRMLRLFGFEFTTREVGGNPVDSLVPATRTADVTIAIPGDISSAAFWIAGALAVPGSRVHIPQVGLNPSRSAFLLAARAMGGMIDISIDSGGIEPSGTVTVVGARSLAGIEIDEHHPLYPVQLLIDELPILALLGAVASGRTVVRGARELRTKETDRIAGIVTLLNGLGIRVDEFDDGFVVEGGQRILGGEVDSRGDHRLAMVAGIASLVSEGPVIVSNASVAAVSYPSFWSDLERITGRANPRNDTGPS